MYGVLDFILLFILLVEIFVSFHRKSALVKLTDAISKLTIKSEKEADFIQGIANYSLSPKKQFVFMLGSLWMLLRVVCKMSKPKHSGKKHFDVEHDENYGYFVYAARLNMITTSLTMFFITTVIHNLISIVVSLVPSNDKRHLINDSVIDTVIEKYAH